MLDYLYSLIDTFKYIFFISSCGKVALKRFTYMGMRLI